MRMGSLIRYAIMRYQEIRLKLSLIHISVNGGIKDDNGDYLVTLSVPAISTAMTEVAFLHFSTDVYKRQSRACSLSTALT